MAQLAVLPDPHSLQQEAPKWKLLRVADVRGASYNPACRTQPKRLKSLLKSITEIGLLYPILVDERNEVIDGHRRLACARELEWETIPAIVVADTRGNRDSIYASVNVTANKMNGNESLSAWLANAHAASPRNQKIFAEMSNSLGLGLVKTLAERGLSARVYQTGCRIGRYCGDTSNVFLVKAVRWLMEVAVIGQVMKAMEGGISAADLKAAVTNGKPLRVVVSN